MGTVPDSQSTRLSQRGTTAPSNDLPVEIINDSASPHGGETDPAGSVVLNDNSDADER